MSLTISLDVSGLINRLNSMEAKLNEFPKHMADELTDWQTEDMKRRYPNTETEENAVSTNIWPTSRVVERDQKKINAILKNKSRTRVVARAKGQRPILRPVLFEKLVQRMDDLMGKELTWR
jgi:hypothetical protein